MATDPELPDNAQLATTGAAVGLGCSIVVTLVGMIGGGVLLDQWLDTAPVLTLVGVALGLIGAGYELYELARVGRRDREAGPLGRRLGQLTSGRRQGSGSAPASGRSERVRMDGEE